MRNNVHKKSILNFHAPAIGIFIHLLMAIVVFVFWMFAGFIMQMFHCWYTGKGFSYLFEEGNQYYGLEIAAIFASFFTILFIIFIIEQLYKEKLSSYLNLENIVVNIKKSFIYILIYILFMLSINFIIWHFNLFNINEIDEVAEFIRDNGELKLTILSIGIFAPIYEEVFFRGFLFKHLEIKWGAFWTILFTSVIFTIIHGQYWEEPLKLLLFLFPLAILLGYSRWKTKSLIIPIIIHCLHNTIVTIILFLN